MIGEAIAHYRITALIGKGGMGEVYRARDTKLDRDVAIKVLPEAFARDPERMARFEREAKVLASLNHPNIAHIYGVEDRALIMEFVDGESPKGPLPFDEAWKIASQMADALEYAHEKGVIHRDLKPANVKVTPEGVVKLLDFGLAKAYSAKADSASHDPENSPTLTMGATVAGTVMGTAAYMAPEQAKGKQVDKRADIWSWGVVLYELLTGERLFKGEDTADTLVQVLTKEPDFERVPTQIRRLLGRCLEKEPKLRLRDIGDSKALLDTPSPRAGRTPSRLAWIINAALALIAGVLGVLYLRQTPPNAPVIRSSILPPEESAGFVLDANVGGSAISPDGRLLAFVANVKGRPMLFVRSLDSSSARMLPGTEDASRPFWSPDSRNIGFASAGKLKRIAVNEGAPRDICDLLNNVMRGASWSRDDVILFASQIDGALKRVTAGGGKLQAVTTLDQPTGELYHYWPYFLPDGKHFLYLARNQTMAQSAIYAASLDDARGARRVRLVEARSGAIFAPSPEHLQSGYILYRQGASVMAQAFDSEALKLTGEAQPLAQDVGGSDSNAYTDLSATLTGALAYGTAKQELRRLVWFRRDGTKSELLPDLGLWAEARVSPDGRNVASRRVDANGRSDVWIIDVARGAARKLTFTGDIIRVPVWSPDGGTIAYQRQGKGLFLMEADSAGEPKLLLATPGRQIGLASAGAADWSDDGKLVLFTTPTPAGLELSTIALDSIGAAATPVPFLRVTADAGRSQPRFSPGSTGARRVAYHSDETGITQVYLRDFPSGRGQRQISIDGGQSPVWSRDGKELFYLGVGKLMRVAITTNGGSFVAGKPEPLFDRPDRFANLSFDVAPDGRFLFSVPDEQDQPRLEPITLVQNWQAALKK